MKYLQLLSLFATFLLLVLAKIPKVTQKVILDIEIDGEKSGKIEIGLFGKTVPKTVKNFVELCKRPYWRGYKGSNFYYINRNSLMQAGYFTEENGEPGMSYYGYVFNKEISELKHFGAGWVSMTTTEQGFVNVQFFIITKKEEFFDEKFVVFGKVVKGMDVVWEMANVEVDSNKKPIKDVVIADCTVEKVKKPYIVEFTDATE